MRKLTEPHMLFHLGLAGVGVALLLAGSSIGIFLIACALMMVLMMGAMGGPDDRASGGRGHH